MIGHRLPKAVRRLPLPRGERALAAAVTHDGVPVVGTRVALHVGERRIGWEQVHRADWDPEAGRLTVAEIGEFAAQRPTHVLEFDDPGLLLELVRERVTSTMVLQRHVSLQGKAGVFIIGRRAPGGETVWYFDFEDGVDPLDSSVRQAAHEAMARIRADFGV